MRASRSARLARISHTLAGAGSVLAAPRAFRALPIQPVSAAALKTLGTTMPFAIIPQGYEKCGLITPGGLITRYRRRGRGAGEPVWAVAWSRTADRPGHSIRPASRWAA